MLRVGGFLRRLCTHTSRSATGVHYTLAPNSGGSGAVLALVHGAPGSARDFRHLVAAIADRGHGDKFRCLSLDLPGHGVTPEDGAADQESMARALWSAIDAAAPDAPVVLLGHSIGGHTVLEAARQRPALGVALLAPVNLTPHRALMDERYFTRVRPLLRLLDHPLLGAPIAAFSEFFLKRVLGFPKHVTRREIVHTNRRVALIDWDGARATAGALQLPVFLAYALDDALIQPERSEELAEVLGRDAARDGPRLVYDTGGHNIQKTQAEGLADALAEWIGGLRES